MTNVQLKLIHIASSQVGLSEAQYRTLLHNVAGVASAKALTNAAYEDCMAVFEDLGFRQKGAGDDYWRQKVSDRGSRPGARMTFRIEELAKECRYSLESLCLRFSDQRTADIEQLRPREAWKLIEAMKAMNAREADHAGA